MSAVRQATLRLSPSASLGASAKQGEISRSTYAVELLGLSTISTFAGARAMFSFSSVAFSTSALKLGFMLILTVAFMGDTSNKV